jgi:hypothetical protein
LSVCLGKHLFSFRAESVRGVRFANAGLHAGLGHKSVALEAGKVRSHGVVSQMQLLRELIHGPFLRTQEVEDFAPRGFEQPLSPAYMFH